MARRGAQVTAWTRLRGLVQASHPFPILMVVSLTLLIGIASGGGSPPWGRLALAAGVMLLSQLAIGWSNDYLDREKDARYQPQKPLPSGLVPASLLAALTTISLAGSAVLGGAMGVDVLALLAAGTACGLAYNLYLKETPLSWLPYVAAFAILPPFVWTATATYQEDFGWLYAVAAPLAVAAHVANALPDIEADQMAEARGLVPSLGKTRSLALLYVCLLSPVAAIAATIPWVEYEAAVVAATLVLYFALAGGAAVAYRGQPFTRAAARGFRLVAPAAVVLATGWLAAV